VVLRPADISNAPELIDRFGVVGVNSAVEVDLYGNVNATHIGGTRVVNGIGGGGDFARNCRLGIIALPSTAVGGDVSRIVPLTPHTDHTEHDASVIVTEHGVADLRGLSPRERAAALVEVADPRSASPSTPTANGPRTREVTRRTISTPHFRGNRETRTPSTSYFK